MSELNAGSFGTKPLSSKKTDTMMEKPSKAMGSNLDSSEPEIKQEKEEEQHFDVTQNLYSGVKSVWDFGCHIVVVKPFLKAAEGVAGTVLNYGGIKLDKLDEDIKPKLSELDHGLLDPAIIGVIGFFTPFLHKGKSIIKPIVMKISPRLLGPFDFFKYLKDNGESVDPEVTPTPAS